MCAFVVFFVVFLGVCFIRECDYEQASVHSVVSCSLCLAAFLVTV